MNRRLLPHAVNHDISPIPAATSVVFLLLAILGSWPYGFYTLLRLVVCGSSVYLALQFNSRSSNTWTWVMAGLALLFNPVVPVELTRDTWVVLDLGAALVIGLGTLRIR